MKRIYLLGISLMVLGAAAFLFGGLNGGGRTVYWDHGFNVVGVGANKVQSSNYQNVQQIRVSTSNPTTIQTGNVSHVVVAKPSKTTVTQHGGILNVKGSKHWRKVFFLGGFHSVEENFGTTVITIPKNKNLVSLSANLEEYNTDHLNGHVRLNGISVDRLHYSGESNLALNHVNVTNNLNIDNMGHIAVNSSKFKTGTISNDFGNITLKSNTFGTLSAETDAGFISFNRQNVSKRFTADSEAGSINGQVKRDRRIYIFADSDIGGRSIYGRSRSKYGNRNAKNAVRYHFVTEAGHIKIKE